MKKKILCLILTVLLITASCAHVLAESGSAQEEGDVSMTDNKTENTVLTVKTVGDLSGLTDLKDNTPVLVAGYYEPGDGGGGLFVWRKSSRAIDNGGTAISPDGKATGRFVRSCESDSLNVLWFGAKGDGKTDDTEALRNAIGALPLTGGTVSLPNGVYCVSGTIELGNGDASTVKSSNFGIHLFGDGNAVIKATAEMENVVYLRGQTYNTYIRGIDIDANGKAKNGLKLESFINNRFVNIGITGFTECGLKIMAGGEPTGNYNIYNRFEQINVTATAAGTNCLYMDGVYSLSNDTWISSFANCTFDATGAEDANGAYMKFVDSISLYMCVFRGSADGMVLDARGNNDFPCGMGFYDCSISSLKAIEEGGDRVRKQYFYGYGTHNGEHKPDSAKMIGFTDEGELFNLDALLS